MKRQKKSPDTVEVADTNLEPRDIPLQEPVPTPNDPGGAHAKGYSPDTGPDMQADADTEGPIPLSSAPEQARVRPPKRKGNVRPTGRSEPRAYSPNDRLMGSDR
jgi:hypothetical protein